LQNVLPLHYRKKEAILLTFKIKTYKIMFITNTLDSAIERTTINQTINIKADLKKKGEYKKNKLCLSGWEQAIATCNLEDGLINLAEFYDEIY